MRPYQPHEWGTIVDLIRNHAPWRAFPAVLADADFMAAWLSAFASLEAESNLSSETLLAWWQSSAEYQSEWPKWAAVVTPPDAPKTNEPSHGGDVDRLALPTIATPRGWGDQSGYRPLLFASWFPMLRILRDDPARFARTLDMLQSWGVNGVRAFVGVRHPDYWQGREVLPSWPDFDRLCATAAHALRERGMGWFVTAGDLQLFPDEADVYRRAAHALAAYRDVLTLVDVNEGWQNSRARDNDASHFATLVRPFAAAGVPWATSANGDGDDRASLDVMWRGVGAPVVTIHGPGQPPDLMVRHIFNHRHEDEGVGLRVALCQGEPRGPGEDVSAGRVNETGWVVLAAACAAMTGQLYVLHTSRGVRDRDDDAPWETFAPYVQRAAAVLAHIPRSRVSALGHGGRGGSHPEALFCSTREDGRFHGDAPGIVGEFHRADAVRYENGARACLLYGGTGTRRARAVKALDGVMVDTHGRVVESVSLARGAVWTAPGAEDGYLFVGKDR